ncbi:MAG: hypothetical protein V1681_03675 [Candidatus Neomarinimicrobiota bacterium]
MDLEKKKSAAKEIITRIVEGFGGYVVDFKVNLQGNRTFVKTLVATDQGITLDEIAEITRVVRDDSAFDELFNESLQLEISSPGIDFPLKNIRDFRRNIGREMNIFHHQENIKSPLKGKLTAVEENRLTVMSGTDIISLQIDTIDFAKVVIKW